MYTDSGGLVPTPRHLPEGALFVKGDFFTIFLDDHTNRLPLLAVGQAPYLLGLGTKCIEMTTGPCAPLAPGDWPTDIRYSGALAAQEHGCHKPN